MSAPKGIASWKNRVKTIKRHIFVLYLAYRDPRTPWFAKIFTICVVAYAFSPIDLIPDFIPILGYLDDLIIVPFGIILALKMIPKPVLEDCTIRAEEMKGQRKPKNWIVGAIFICIWILFAVFAVLLLFRKLL